VRALLRRSAGALRRLRAGEPYYRVLPFRLVRRVRREISVRLGERPYRVPTTGAGGAVAAAWRPSWKTHLVGHLLRGRPGAFADVGANVGQTLFDLLAVDPAREYVGFEPNPAAVAFVEGFVRANGLRRATLLPVGLAERAGLFPLYLQRGADADSGASLVDGLRPGRDFDVRYVPCLRFDEAWEAVGAPPIGLVKIDVEGAELGVLRGMGRFLAAERPPILAEVLYADARADLDAYAAGLRELEAFLAGVGYAVYHVVKPGSGVACRLARVDGFPVRVWAPEHAEACDYVLLAAEAPVPSL
jgi:FkbM family methyltransferase